MAEKKCTKCGDVKPLEEFHRKQSRKDGRTSICKACQRDVTQAYYNGLTAEQRTARNAGRKQWIANNPAKARAIYRRAKLHKKYGISVGQYDKLLVAQHGVCAICNRPETLKTAAGDAVCRLAVDHDHATGTVRGLLCNACNAALGFADDDPTRLRALAAYLER